MTKPTLIYVYDPLCGWCYGFHPVMEKLQKRFHDKLNLRVVPGGLAIDQNAQSIKEGYSYISDSLKQVENKTGIKFGENFKLLADEGSYFYDSMPGCKAQNTINQLAPEFALDFAGKLQSAFFVDGMDLNDQSTFHSLIEKYPFEVSAFDAVYSSDEIVNATYSNFEWCKKNGATAFPALLLEIGDETGLMSKGYRPYDTLESHLHHLIRNIEKMSS